MKKFLNPILLAAVLLPMLCQAQTYDTVYNRVPRYHYTVWYDTTDCYYHPLVDDENFYLSQTFCGTHEAYSEYVPEEVALQGIAVVTIEYDSGVLNWVDTNRLPEYALVYELIGKGIYTDSLVVIDSTRWDTAVRKVIRFPNTIDTDQYGFLDAFVSEAMFAHPVLVSDSFALGGTAYNNVPLEEIGAGWFSRKPSCYGGVGNLRLRGERKSYHIFNHSYWTCSGSGAYTQYGYFFPIIDYVNLTVLTSDSARGTVSGGGRHSKDVYRMITTLPSPGYRFSHWNDGNTEDSRLVYLSQDTTLTAYFFKECRVEATSNDNSMGYVSGSGVFLENDEVEIKATAAHGCHFESWNDGVADNPRTIVVTSDTAFVALFSRDQGGEGIAAPESSAFTLTPNPAKGTVAVAVEGTAYRPGQSVLHIADASGREVLCQPLAAPRQQLDLSALPAGIYFVTLATPNASATQKLVME